MYSFGSSPYISMRSSMSRRVETCSSHRFPHKPHHVVLFRQFHLERERETDRERREKEKREGIRLLEWISVSLSLYTYFLQDSTMDGNISTVKKTAGSKIVFFFLPPLSLSSFYFLFLYLLACLSLTILCTYIWYLYREKMKVRACLSASSFFLSFFLW